MFTVIVVALTIVVFLSFKAYFYLKSIRMGELIITKDGVKLDLDEDLETVETLRYVFFKVVRKAAE